MNESESIHVVKEGDTLGEIAERHGTTLGALVSLNQIENPDLIHPGQTLKLKSAEPAAASDETKSPEDQDSTQDAVLRENPIV